MNPDAVLRIGKVFYTPYGGEGVDFVDQLNYQFTGGLLIIFIAVIGIRQYVGKCTNAYMHEYHYHPGSGSYIKKSLYAINFDTMPFGVKLTDILLVGNFPLR